MLMNEAVYHNTDIILIANTLEQDPVIFRMSSVTENDILNLLINNECRCLLVSIFLKKNKDLLYINDLLSSKETITAIVGAINSKKTRNLTLY